MDVAVLDSEIYILLHVIVRSRHTEQALVEYNLCFQIIRAPVVDFTSLLSQNS